MVELPIACTVRSLMNLYVLLATGARYAIKTVAKGLHGTPNYLLGTRRRDASSGRG